MWETQRQGASGLWDVAVTQARRDDSDLKNKMSKILQISHYYYHGKPCATNWEGERVCFTKPQFRPGDTGCLAGGCTNITLIIETSHTYKVNVSFNECYILHWTSCPSLVISLCQIVNACGGHNMYQRRIPPRLHPGNPCRV